MTYEPSTHLGVLVATMHGDPVEGSVAIPCVGCTRLVWIDPQTCIEIDDAFHTHSCSACVRRLSARAEIDLCTTPGALRRAAEYLRRHR